MATFTHGGGTLKSATLEGAFFEAIMLLLSLEKSATFNPALESRITFASDQSLMFAGVCTFTGTETLSLTNDSLTWSVNSYIGGGYVFNPGTNGTLKATNLPAAIVALAKRIQLLEAQSSKNLQSLNRVDIEFNSDAGTVTVKWQTQVDVTIGTTGQTQLTAKTYLTD